MLLRHLVTHFLQQQAKAKVAEALRRGAAADASSAPRATPLLVDGLLLYPSDLEAGGLLDLTKEKQTAYCDGFVEQTGEFASRRIALVEVGEGAGAKEIAKKSLTIINPLWVLSFGFASGLAPAARRGQIVMASRIISEQGGSRPVGLTRSAGQAESPGLHFGDLLTVRSLAKSKAEKERLTQSGAVAWDADSFFVAEAAAGTTMISVRIISEAIDDILPPAVKYFQKQKTLAAKLGAATGTLLDRPQDLTAMWKLREEAIRLSDRLAKFLVGVVEQLPWREANSGKETT